MSKKRSLSETFTSNQIIQNAAKKQRSNSFQPIRWPPASSSNQFVNMLPDLDAFEPANKQPANCWTNLLPDLNAFSNSTQKHTTQKQKQTKNYSKQQKKTHQKKDAAKKTKKRKRKKRKPNSTKKTHNSFRLEAEDETVHITPHYLGKQKMVCKHCQALMWEDEKSNDSSQLQVQFSLCCSKGAIKLKPLAPPPPNLQALWENVHTKESKFFRKHIRALNCAFAMTSIKTEEINMQAPIFKINGTLHHRIGALTPNTHQKHRFAQIYIMDDQQQINLRAALNGLSGNKKQHKQIATKVVTKIQQALMEENFLIKTLKTTHQISQQKNIPNIRLLIRADKKPKTAHSGTYNLPTANEVALLYPNSDALASTVINRDIVIQYKGGYLQQIKETNGLYDALAYPLFHLKAEYGFHTGIKRQKQTATYSM